MNAHLRLKFIGLFSAGVLFCGVSHAQASGYVFTDLGLVDGNPTGASAINNMGQIAGYVSPPIYNGINAVVWQGTAPTVLGAGVAAAINDGGQVAGYSRLGTFSGGNWVQYSHATLWSGTQATYLDTPAGGSSWASSINRPGQVVGGTQLDGSPEYATLWTGTSTVKLGTVGGRYSVAASINDAGLIVGNSTSTGDIDTRPTLWNGTTATDLGTLGGTGGMAYAINNAGQSVGFTLTSGNAAGHATFWNGTQIIDLGTLGGNSSSAYAINNLGQSVGFSNIAGDGAQHAVLWNGTTIVDLNSFLDASQLKEGWVLGQARGINDLGQIVVDATIKGVSHALVLTPVPEPDTRATMLLGLVGMGWVARQRRSNTKSLIA